MPQNSWFTENAPAQGSWFEQNAPTPGASLRPEKDTISRLLDGLPAAGGAAGGILGGLGGALIPIANMTGAPEAAGAMGGAALGGAAGESLRQLIESWRGTGNGARPAVQPSLKRTADAAAEQATAEVVGRGVSAGVGATLKKVGPWVYQQGIPMTPTMKMEFPNAAQTAIDSGVKVPTAPRIQGALNKVEDQLNRKVMAHDLQPTLTPRKALPPASRSIPTGPIPTPQGGAPAVTRADLFNPYKDAIGPLADVTPNRMFGPDRNYLSSPLGEAIADRVEGPGAIRGPLDTSRIPTAPGAPPGMIDPRAIGNAAFGRASNAADLTTRGIREEPQAEMQGYLDRFLRDNTESYSAMRTLKLKRAEQGLVTYPKAGDVAERTEKIPNAWHRSVATEARAALEGEVQGSNKLLAQEQGLLGALKGATRDTGGSNLRHMLAAGLAGQMTPQGLAAALAVEMQRSPYLMGPAGYGLTKAGQGMAAPSFQKLFAPNALRSAILGLSPDSE